MKKTEPGASVKLEWKFMTLAIFCGVGLVQTGTLAEKKHKKTSKIQEPFNVLKANVYNNWLLSKKKIKE